nr:unnamed protein product [Callosobruchus chinensis]
MDVLVKWKSGSLNVVSSKDIKPVIKNSVLRRGVEVKMYWSPEKRYYVGTVISTATESDDSDDNIPLSALLKREKQSSSSKMNVPKDKSDSDEDIPLSVLKDSLTIADFVPRLQVDCDTHIDKIPIQAPSEVNLAAISTQNMEEHLSISYNANSNDYFSRSTTDMDYPMNVQNCEVLSCKGEVFAACGRCNVLLCWNHFEINDNCNRHGNFSDYRLKNDLCETGVTESSADKPLSATGSSRSVDDVFSKYAVDGEKRETPFKKVVRTNKKKIAHQLRIRGKSYVSSATRKPKPGKIMKPRCDQSKCIQECISIDEEQRKNMFEAFYGTGSLQLQREFIVRYVEAQKVKRRRTQADNSRRTLTLSYTLPKGNGKVSVCKTMFINTLGISEKTLRTAMSKRTEEGVVEKERRGGRIKDLKEKDEKVRGSVLEHIQRFPRMESHYCRKSTTREYLYADLTVKKMFSLYEEENAGKDTMCSYHTYRRVFRSLNLSFHHPKKDQCSLCMTYRQGTDEQKRAIETVFVEHTNQKNAVRQKKDKVKELSKTYPNIIASAVFDLQQVITLPISNEAAIFYRKRLSVFNFTIYDIGNKECICFQWDETISKRGANEVSSCVASYLRDLDNRGMFEVNLFADGCGGQNRNTIVFTMLLHTITNAKSLRNISLSFFETNHGQNEGDSAHSSIATAMSLVGNISVPSELPPIFRLARRAQPYKVMVMSSNSFFDYKLLSEKIRLKSTRMFTTGEKVDWSKVREVKVDKRNPAQFLMKNSHLSDNYFILPMKRNSLGALAEPLQELKGPIKLQKDKYLHLLSLCTGDKPVVKHPNFQKYYKDLPHED